MFRLPVNGEPLLLLGALILSLRERFADLSSTERPRYTVSGDLSTDCLWEGLSNSYR